MLAYYAGYAVGAGIGSVVIGALFGWVLRSIFRLSWLVADAIGIILMVLAASAVSSANGTLPYSAALAVYALGGLFAWVVLWWRRGRLTSADRYSGSSRWKRPVGIALVIVLGALGSTSLFAAFRQVFQPSDMGGSAEFMFLLGVMLLTPCVFILIYWIRPSPLNEREPKPHLGTGGNDG